MPFGTENLPLSLVNQEDATTWPAQQLYDLVWTFGTGYDYLSFDFDHNMDTVDALLAPPNDLLAVAGTLRPRCRRLSTISPDVSNVASWPVSSSGISVGR
jgi:hypothetical protein